MTDATKLKSDGIGKDDVMTMYDLVEKTVNSITTTADKTEEKKNKTVSLLSDTKDAIETAYGTRVGGNE